jgi:tetratricopeptide (TPR) repeat protein
MLETDPLNHFARFEKIMVADREVHSAEFMNGITNEFPEETCLEIALYYQSLQLTDEAVKILSWGPDVVKNNLWLAYLLRKTDPGKSMEILEQSLNKSPEFVFPYRRETLEMLMWANEKMDSWKLKYYLGLNLAAVGRKEEAMDQLRECGNEPDSWVFYMTRADLPGDPVNDEVFRDIQRAWELESRNWRTWNRMVRYYERNQEYDLAVDMAKKAYRTFPGNHNVGFQYAKALLNTGDYGDCIKILTDIQILPFEGSYESRLVYERAHLKLALEYIADRKYRKAVETLNQAQEWPENIGVGKPYEPDERMQEFLLAYCYDKLGDKEKYDEYLQQVINYTENRSHSAQPENLLGLVALNLAGKPDQADVLYQKIVSNRELSEKYRQWLSDRYKASANPGASNQAEEGSPEYTLATQISGIFKE